MAFLLASFFLKIHLINFVFDIPLTNIKSLFFVCHCWGKKKILKPSSFITTSTMLPLVSEGVVVNSQQSDSLTQPASSALVCNKQIADNYCVLLSCFLRVRMYACVCLFVCVYVLLINSY